jgi:hypothetical protein
MYNTVDVPTLYAQNKNKTQAFEVAASGSYLKDRLSYVVGFRRDRSELDTLNGNTATRDTKTGAFTAYTPDNRIGFNNTTTFGLVYFPIKYVGVYANHGEGFTIATSSNLALDGSFNKASIVPATEKSAGLRFQLGGGSKVKVVGSVGYYEATQKKIIKPLGVGNINSLWRDLGILEGNPGKYLDNVIETFSGDPYSTAATNSINSYQNIVGSGWEASLTANIGNSFRLTVNGALPKTKLSDSITDYVALVAPWIPRFAPLASNTISTTSSTSIGQLIQNIDGAQEGRSQDKTFKYRANIFGVYTFNRTVLKGLRLGGGVQFYGKSQIGNAPNQAYNYVYDGTYYLVAGQIGYGFKMGRQKIDVQLNIDNLLDNKRTIYTGLIPQTFNGVATVVPYGNKQVWPRAYRLTVSIPF